jgi:hypothetical protein
VTNFNVVVFDALTAVAMKSSIFSDITLFRPVKVSRGFGETYHLHLQGRRGSLFDIYFMLVYFWAYFSTMKVEATRSPGTSVDFERIAWRYIIKDKTLQF